MNIQFDRVSVKAGFLTAFNFAKMIAHEDDVVSVKAGFLTAFNKHWAFNSGVRWGCLSQSRISHGFQLCAFESPEYVTASLSQSRISHGFQYTKSFLPRYGIIVSVKAGFLTAFNY